MSDPTPPPDSGLTDPWVEELQGLLDALPDDLALAARDLARRACEGPTPAVRQRFLTLVDHLEGKAFDMSRLLAVRGPREGLVLARTVEVLDVLRDVALTHLGDQPSDVLAEIDREEKWLSELGSEGEEIRDFDLRSRLDQLSVARIDGLVDNPAAGHRPGSRLRVIAEVTADLVRRGQQDLVDRLASARARLWGHLLRRSRTVEGTAGRQFARQLADEVNDHAEDILARAEGLTDAAAIYLLTTASRDVRRAAALVRPLDHRPESDLRRMNRRVRAVLQDRKVRHRQVEQVGPTRLKIIDWLVVVGIVSVLGILLVDVFLNPSPPVRLALAWVDAAICVGFLAEFGWRWKVSGFSGGYFRRCFFIDVLPSIPFGLITELAPAIPDAAGKGDAVRGLRGLRALRILRGLRLLRPVFQVYRLLAFTLQGMDRLVRRNARLLNRNVVLFDPPEDDEEGAVDLSVRLRRFRDRLTRALRLTLSELSPPLRIHLEKMRFSALARRLELAPHCELRTLGPDSDLRDIRMEVMIGELLTLEPTTVEVNLGEDGAARVARVIRLLDVPLIRRLPLVRDVVSNTTGLDPYQVLTQAGQGLGRFLDRFVERVRFVGDLTGIVTGSQLLDRIGSTLVRATYRPAIRLLMLGFTALLVSWMVDFFDLPLQRLAENLGRVLGKGVIILGAICLVIQGFGRWIRHLAGEATELFEKVAEAQGINLLKFEKLDHRESDLGFLFDRVVAAEIRVTGDPTPPDEAKASFCRLHPHEMGSDTEANRAFMAVHDQVCLLYLDYLDGATLHRSNVKSTEQFLGNLDLESIRTERLSLDKKSQKRLRKLDLNRDRAVPTGPYLWFRFITESLSQRVAKLVLHYNAVAVPLQHLPVVTPIARDRHQEWLAAPPPRRPTTHSGRPALNTVRDRLVRGLWFVLWPLILVYRFLEDVVRGVVAILLRATRVFRSDPKSVAEGSGFTRFHALHFLTPDRFRDHQVEEEYGPEVLKRLVRDRQSMIREVFSCYPWEHLPRHRRTYNPYVLYFQWLGRGRVVVLPIRLLWAWVRMTTRTLQSFVRLIREQLAPAALRPERSPGHATLDVALRKINRMHQPVFMAALELRALFDPEFHGVPLPGQDTGPDPGFASVREDLDFIGAREDRREILRTRRAEVTALVKRFERQLEGRGWPQQNLWEALDPANTTRSAAGPLEALRAATVAWVIDYRNCRSLITAGLDIERAVESSVAQPGNARPKRKFWRREHRQRFDQWAQGSGFASRGEDVLGIARRAYALNRGRIRTLMTLLEQNGGSEHGPTRGWRTLAEVARYPEPWSRQLVTLRAVQSLCCLDILRTRELVRDLGGFDQEG